VTTPLPDQADTPPETPRGPAGQDRSDDPPARPTLILLEPGGETCLPGQLCD
jgi:hypothetical protein